MRQIRWRAARPADRHHQRSEQQLSADDADLLPVADTVNALTTTLPAFDGNIFVDQLEAGYLIAAIGDPIAADVALVPFALFLGLGTITDAIEGTHLNIADLIP